MRLVLDTCVIVSAFRSRDGASRRLLDLLAGGRFDAIVNTALFFEYEYVLSRDEQVLQHGYRSSEISTFLEAFARLSVCVPRMHWQVKPQLRDPNDELVLEAAINGYADAIVTFNEKDFLPAANVYGKRVVKPGIIIKERFQL